MIVDFEFTNNGDKAITLDSSLLTLLDSKSREYQVDTDNMFLRSPRQEHLPGAGKTQGLRRRVRPSSAWPPNTQTFDLGVSEGFFGTNTGKIELGTLESGSSSDTGSTSTESASGLQPSSVTASSTSSSAPDASGNTISYSPENAVGRPELNGLETWTETVSGSPITLNYDQPVYREPNRDDPRLRQGGFNRWKHTASTSSTSSRRRGWSFSDGTSVEANFDRDPSMQYTDIPNITTDSVKITILDTYPPGNSPEGDNYPYTLDKAAISEIQVEGP